MLVRFGNRYVEVKDPANNLKDLAAVPFEDADMLDIHLQVAALSDIVDADADKPKPEQLEADCMAAIKAVTRLGPPITMGHPDVDLFEERSLEYARHLRSKAVAEGERRVAKGLAEAKDLTTERFQNRSAQLAAVGDHGRVPDYRASFIKNAIIALSTVATALGNAATGAVAGDVVVAAAQFLLLHADAIMATAPAWGESGYRWAAHLIDEADRIIKDAKKR